MSIICLKKEKLDSLAKEHRLINKKTNLFKQYYNNVLSWLDDAYNNKHHFYDFIEKTKKEYGISIYWNYSSTHYDFPVPATLRVNESINYIQAYRYMPHIDKFLKTFSKSFISSELNNIVLTGSMHYVNSTSDIGGTYDTYSGSLYLSNIGNEDLFLKGLIFHEFGHILLSKYWDLFPYEQWIKINPSDVEYTVGGIKKNKPWYDTGEDYYDFGFINNYATYRFDDDFTELFNWMFVREEKLKTIRKNHERIQLKYDLVISFLENTGVELD